MPNWVTIEMRVKAPTKAALSAFVSAVASGEGKDATALDFDKIIPMPKSLNIVSGTETDTGLQLFHPAVARKAGLRPATDLLTYPWVPEGIKTLDDLKAYIERERPEAKRMGDIAAGNFRKYGATTWYDWATRNWGTKWNASDAVLQSVSATKARYTFQTAWSFPTPVLAKLVQTFPDLTFSGEATEEGAFFGAYFDGAILTFTESPEWDEKTESYGDVRKCKVEETITLTDA